MKTINLRLAALAVLLLGFALRVFRLDYQELRGDEVFGYFFMLRPFGEIVTATLELQEPHPVASYFAGKSWLMLAGASEFALRFASVWFGVLAIALLGRLAHALRLDGRVAAAAMGLLAISPYAIWHAQDARMYSMSLALTTASSWLALAWLQETGRRRWAWAVGYILVSWLALHTHYFAVFVLLAHYLYVMGVGIWRRAWRRTVAPWILIQALVALLYLPWLLGAAATLTAYGGNGDSPALGEMLERTLVVFGAGESVPPAQRPTVLWLAALLLLLGCLRLFRQRRGDAAIFLLLYLLVPAGATWLSAQQRPIFDERYLVAALPPFLLLIAATLQPPAARETSRAYPSLRLTSVVLFSALIVVMLLSLQRHYDEPTVSKTRGWRELAVALEEASAGLPPDQVRIAENYPDPTLWYYYAGPVDHLVLPPRARDADGAQQAVAALQDAGVRRVILPEQPSPDWDDAGLARQALQAEYALLTERQTAGWPVAIFAAEPVALSTTDAVWRNGLRLAAAGLEPPTLTPGAPLAVWLQWDGATAALNGTEKVFVQLLGPDGTVIAQHDQPLAQDDAVGLRLHGLTLPAALPAGSYRLIAGVYDPSQNAAPRLQLQDGDDAVTLAAWQIEP